MADAVVGVLDGLRLVQHHVVELDLGELGGVAEQRAVGGQHQVVIGDQRGVARQAGVLQDAQLRREPRRLRAPVEHQRFRRDHQRRPASPPSRARFEHRQHLRGLADAHIVGQAAAEAELAQELHPAEAFALVIAQLADEARRLRRRASTPWKVAQLLADAREHLVDVDFGLRRQQRVEQARLVAPEAQVVFLVGAESGQRREARQPFLGQQAEGAVARAGPWSRRGARRRATAAALAADAAVVHFAVQLEPVDAAS